MLTRKSGIATAILAVAVVVIIVIGGVAAYEVVGTKSGSSSNTSSTTSSQASSSASSSGSSSTTNSAASSTAAVTSSCGTTSSSGSSSTAFNVAPFVTAFSAMKLSYNLTSGGQSENLTEAYTRVYASSTTLKILVNATVAGGENLGETAWILKNGTVLAINIEGTNLTGNAAQTGIVGVMAGFSAEVQAAGQLSTYTQTAYFHSTGTQSVTIGGNTFTVTNWSANSLPETITSCPSGSSSSITSFVLQVGVPKGSSTNIVTRFEYAGSETSDGQTSNVDYVIQVVSFTVA